MSDTFDWGTGATLKTNLQDLLNGATFFGSGGGGPRVMGDVVSKLVAGGMPKVVGPDDMADDEWAVIAAGVGSPDQAKNFDPKVVADAVDVMATALGIKITHILAAEIGAGNTFMPIAAAHYRDCKVLDAAVASRAVPKITMSTFAANDIPVGHMTMANQDAQLTMKAGPATDLSAPMRSLLSAPPFDQVAGLAIWPVQGKVVKDLAIAGTLTKARNLGAAIRKAADGEKIAAAIEATGGRVLGSGTSKTQTTTGGGFDHSLISISGSDDEVLTIVSVNENLLAFSSGDGAVAAAPDLISYIRTDGTVISNVELADGDDIVVIGSPAGPAMLTDGMLGQFKELLGNPLGYYGPVPLIEG